MIPPELSLLPSPWSRCPFWGGLGPRSGLYGPGGWWGGINAEPPYSEPVYGGPSRGDFHEEHRNPQRLKSCSHIKNTCPPKDGPEIMQDKSDCLICQHFAKRGHCWYKDLCAFYHPGVGGAPLQYYAFPSGLERALCDLEIICVLVALGWLLWGSSTHYLSQRCRPSLPLPPLGVQSCVFSIIALYVLFLLIQPLESHLQDPIFISIAASCILFPFTEWLINRKPLWYCFLCISPPSPQYFCHSMRGNTVPWNSGLSFSFSSCLF